MQTNHAHTSRRRAGILLLTALIITALTLIACGAENNNQPQLDAYSPPLTEPYAPADEQTSDAAPISTLPTTTSTAVPAEQPDAPAETIVGPSPDNGETSQSDPAATETNASAPDGTDPNTPSTTTTPPVTTSTAPPHTHDDPEDPEDSSGHAETELVIDLDGLLPAEPGGPLTVPWWFENFKPDWQPQNRTARAFADWCYEPLYELAKSEPERAKEHAYDCTSWLHSMMAPLDPLIQADQGCLLAVSQHGIARYVNKWPEWAGVWLPTTTLPPHIAAGAFPSWADCPTLLWGTALPDRGIAEAAEEICVAVSDQFSAIEAADCPTLLWDTPLPDRSDTEAAEAACVAISIKFRAMRGTVVPDNGGLRIGWDTDTCIGSRWPEDMSKCSFAFKVYREAVSEAGRMVYGTTWTSGLGCPS